MSLRGLAMRPDRKRLFGLRAAILLVASLGCWHGTGLAASPIEHHPVASAWPQPLESTGPTTPAEMEAFLDGFMRARSTGPFAGAAIAVVKDGALFFSKGYGFADVDKQLPVDPAHTLFRAASVSKVFTWTSVMQLVEQGKLDLDADVNTYLKDMKVPATFSAPITLRNILTHTTGLEDGFLGYALAPTIDKDRLSLRDFLVQHRATRVRPPTTDFGDGSNASYSNWATALAGHIVESVSGMPYDDYVREHIFRPLGMTSSTFNEPLPSDLAARLAKGYELNAGKFEPQPFELIHNFAPAGALTTSVTDMARFLTAHLEGGAVEGGRILKPETVELMHARTLSPDPSLNGSTLGFYELWANGHRVISHAGDTGQFHSILSLMPESHLGLFVVFNTGGKVGATPFKLERVFFEHYFPARLPQIKPPADAVQRNQRYVGTYRTLRRSYTKVEKVLSMFQDTKVMAMPDGTLFTNSNPLAGDQRWVEVGDGVFREMYRDNFMAFKHIENGHATALVDLTLPCLAAQRVHWYETGMVHGIVLLVSAALFVAMLVSAIRRRRSEGTGLRWARPVLALGGILLTLFPIVLAMAVSGSTGELATQIPTALSLALTLPLLALPAIVVAIYFMARLWRTSAWTVSSRVQYTLTVLAAVVCLLLLSYWNLLGYRFG